MERNNNFEENEMIIDVGELLSVLWSKIHIIILVGVVFASTAFAATKVLVTPKYDSMTKIFIIPRQNESTVTFSDLQTGTQLTKDYAELVKSRPVMEDVISALNLKVSPGTLANTVTVQRLPDTRIIRIVVRNENPKMAKRIADAVREAASVQIKEVMSLDAVNTVEEASLPGVQSTPNTKKNTMIAGCIGVFLTIGIIMILFLLDDTIKTPEDVERYLKLNVLASIPIEKEENKKVKKNKKRR